jgi:chromate transporter
VTAGGHGASAIHDPPLPTFADAARVWWRIGWLSFGGPTAQIALMHRVLVNERRWLREPEFLDALGFCMLLPGPEAMQLATYAGWKLHGVRGGLMAGLAFVLPGALVVLTLAATYARFGHQPLVLATFQGIKACVLVLVIEALLRIARRALTRARQVAIAVAAFVAIFALAAPFPLIVLAAGLLGLAWPVAAGTPVEASAARIAWPRTLRTVCTWMAVWVLPLLGVAAAFGPEHVLTQLAWFFSKLAIVTFGGAYAVLAYMSQDVVVHHGWLTAGQMLDGLGLAETTPGPLILVTEFVGFLAAAHANPAAAFAYGLLGAAVALWATFAPCFLWVFTGAPYIVLLSERPRLQHALSAITAAVLGVIMNLALWFAIHVLFARVTTLHSGLVRVTLPELATLEPRLLVLAAVSGVLLLGLRWSVHRTLAATAALALVLELLARWA